MFEAIQCAPKFTEIPDKIRGYSLLHEIEHGSFGIVVEAVDLKTDKRVALKICSRQNLTNFGQFSSFEQELRVHLGLHHSNILQIYDIIFLQKYIVVVQELCAYDMFSLLQLNKTLSHSMIQSIFSEIVFGIAYLHKKGIAHRDIKPENILLDFKNSVRITDFGCCEVHGKSSFPNFYGTPIYSPPECAIFSPNIVSSKSMTFSQDQIDTEDEYQRDSFLSQSGDIWAIGIILFLMIDHHYPWIHMEPKYRYDEIDKIISNLNPNSPYTYVLQQCLKRDPRQRITANELLEVPWIKVNLPHDHEALQSLYPTKRLRPLEKRQKLRRSVQFFGTQNQSHIPVITSLKKQKHKSCNFINIGLY